MKKIISPLVLFLVAWISVVIVSEIFFHDVVKQQGGLFLFASIAAAAILAFIRELITYVIEARKLKDEKTPETEISDDSKLTDIPWSSLDQNLIRKYFELCREPLKTNNNLQQYFISLGLARKFNDNLYLTHAGVLLFCKKDKFPHTLFHTDVNINISDGKHEFSRDLSGPIFGLFFDIKDQLIQYWQPLKIPSFRDQEGRELIIINYPEVAMIEVIVNFLIHRNYYNDDIGTITILKDRIEFVNPGKSVIPPDQMLNVEKPLRPIYKRNQRLIQVFRKTGLNQREGGGILRIKESLLKNENAGVDGSLPLDIQNDNKTDRFKLVMICKQAPDLAEDELEQPEQQDASPLWRALSRLFKRTSPMSGGPGFGKAEWVRKTLAGRARVKPSAYLVWQTENARKLGEKFGLRRGSPTTIGRNPITNLIAFPDTSEYLSISGEHLMISYNRQDSCWYIKDMESTNGTQLNGVQLKPLEDTLLNNNDTITMGILEHGGIQFVFEIELENNTTNEDEPSDSYDQFKAEFKAKFSDFYEEPND